MRTWEEIKQEIERCKGEHHIAVECHDGYTQRMLEMRIKALEWVMNEGEHHGR